MPGFAAVSPSVGELDEAALDELLEDSPDDALELLAEMSGATDERLRALARRLAGRITLRFAVVAGAARSRGIGKLRREPFSAGGELDLDASLDALVAARAAGVPVDVRELPARGWGAPSAAFCLLVDRSGSMSGQRLATAALATAAVAARAPQDYSVVAFGADALVLKAQDQPSEPGPVIDSVLRLRGRGTTDLALGLRVAAAQLHRSGAQRKTVLLLSDARATTGGDPVAAARALDVLCVLAPEGDSNDAEQLAAAAGGRCATVRGPGSIPVALAALVP